MAKENVGKFYDKLAQDAALAEKLNALDKKFDESNEASLDDAAMREKAAAAIVLPLAEEIGLPFTIEELKEYEEEQLREMTLSDDELDQVAGGYLKDSSDSSKSKRVDCNHAACAYIGVEIGLKKKNGKTAFCIIIGGSSGPIAG